MEIGEPIAYCINLDTRPDKWKDTEDAFRSTGISLQRFSGIKKSEGWKGCGASHVAVAHKALRKGLPWVLVIEDDCLPSADFAKRWPTIRDALWAEKGAWDIFLGGPTYVQGPINPRGGPLIDIDQGFALHFYVLNSSAYEKAIAWNADRHGPIDVYYSDQFRIVTTHPVIATQRPSTSDIKQAHCDYTDHFQDTEETMMRLIYSFQTRHGSILLLAVSLGLLFWLYERRK